MPEIKVIMKNFQLSAITRPEDKGCGYSRACLDNFYLPKVWKLLKSWLLVTPEIHQSTKQHTVITS